MKMDKYALSTEQNYAAQAQAGAATTIIQNASESIVSRLNNIRANLTENSMSASRLADKIVGTAPAPINSTGQSEVERAPAGYFLDSVQQALTDIERIGSELQDHLNRLHRSF